MGRFSATLYGCRLEFDRGAFDDWCLYLTRPDGSRHAPRDRDYFAQLSAYARKHAAARLYADFAAIYDRTTPSPDPAMFPFIQGLCAKYGGDAREIALLFAIIYMGMVAEENKTNAPLGKRIKRLGIHQLLLEGYAPSAAADFSRNRLFRDLAVRCEERGF